MKKFLIIFLSVVIVFSACRKEDAPIFDKSPDERLNEALTKYQTQLASAQYGWKGLIYPKAGGTYTFYFKFNNLNRVQMLSGFDSASAVTIKESSYRLKALQQPSLIFDTYSYLHVLSDPSPDVNGVGGNVGLQSDFEYYFDSSSADTINLVGRVNGSKAVLIRATQAEATAFNNGQLANGLLLNKILTYYKRLTIGSVALDFYFDPNLQTIKWTDNTGNLLDSSRISGYYLTLGGIDLVKPLTAGNQTISRISNVNFISGNQTISCTVNNVAATVSPVVVPLKVDVGAPKRWWQYAIDNGAKYWVTVNGFHVNGVDDAYNLASIPGYEGFSIFFPRFRVSGGVNYDLFSPITNGAIEFGSAFRPPTFTADGRVIFPFLGTLGTVPATGNLQYSNTRNQITDVNGYYLVQTSANTYDMVGARDGKAWITWEWVF
jgi:hypothetical protein